jgi:hypothetical protein
MSGSAQGVLQLDPRLAAFEQENAQSAGSAPRG